MKPPILYLPPPPGNLLTLTNLKLVPWDPPDGEDHFTVYTLGQKLRAKEPVRAWLDKFDIQLLPYQREGFYALITPEWRKAANRNFYELEETDLDEL